MPTIVGTNQEIGEILATYLMLSVKSESDVEEVITVMLLTVLLNMQRSG